MRAMGFIADPLRHFDTAAETTLFLMQEAARRGYRILACTPNDLVLKGNEPWAAMQEIELLWPRQRDPFYQVHALKQVRLATLAGLFLRKDPPFDLPFLHHLYMLAPLRGIVPMVNDPVAVMQANEKLVALEFPRWTPETLVASDAAALTRFIAGHRQGAVIKPLHAAGGRGVIRIERSEPNLDALLFAATEGGRWPVVCQEFLPGIIKGDKRILIAGGEPIGAFLRKAKPGEFRANLHLGGSFHKTILTPREKKLATEVGLALAARGLLFAGLDVIDGHLTEINVTSPMGIRELNLTAGGRAERRVFDCVGF